MIEFELDMLGGIKYRCKQLDMEDYRRIMRLRQWMVGLAFPGYLDIDIAESKNIGGYAFLRPDTVYVLSYERPRAKVVICTTSSSLSDFYNDILYDYGDERREYVYRYNRMGEKNERWITCYRICDYLEYIQKIFDPYFIKAPQLFEAASEEMVILKNTIFETFLIRIMLLALELYSKYDFYPDPYELYDVLATCENKTALVEIMQEAAKFLPERRFSL